MTEDIENYHQNTAIAALMTLLNELRHARPKTQDTRHCMDDGSFSYGVRILVQLLAPFAPHLAEHLWIEKLGNHESVFKSQWPKWELIEQENVIVIVQINGKKRASLHLPKHSTASLVKSEALKITKVSDRIKAIKKVIFVPNKLINFVADENY